MAFSATTEWDVRTTGSDTNGGGFDTASTGTDYSQQDAPLFTYTDLVIGSTNTQLTSAAHPFTSAHVGNIINLTGGTGFTVQRVQITSVAGATATCDKGCGTASSTGGTGSLGGGLATLVTVWPLRVSSNITWLKTGTYTLTAALDTNFNFGLNGYGSSHGDNGTAPLITTATNSTNLFTVSAGGQNWYFFRNLSFSNTATTRAVALSNGNFNGPPTLTVLECRFTGFSNAIASGSNSINLILSNSTISSSQTSAVQGNGGFAAVITGTVLTGSGSNQIDMNPGGGAAVLSVFRTQIVAGGAAGIAIGTSGGTRRLFVCECTIAGNTGDGINIPSASTNFASVPFLLVENTILYGNGGYGINFVQPAPAKTAYPYSRNNAYGANTLGAVQNVPTGPGVVTLTANPFTNSAGGDYTLNASAGGGAACKQAGFQWS